ncbi:hypothetical protein Scep_020814 [Stephania cephalantha]|uniref:Uncharacterized protein n=1 Tax=Stephania cephalantha TaxID=152367 RepID=A0AAP0F4X7_9MAGN
MISTPSNSLTLQQQQCNNNNNAGSSSDLRLSTYKIHHHSPIELEIEPRPHRGLRSYKSRPDL